MNRHFTDARYYLGRAAEHLKAGFREEFRDLEGRVRTTGRNGEGEPGRIERVRAELKEMETRAEGEGRKAVQRARQRIQRTPR